MVQFFKSMSKKEIIDNIINGSPNRLREKYFFKYYKDVYDIIFEFTSKISDIPFKWKVWHWINNIDTYILCKCGKRVSAHLKWSDGYRNFCSVKCASNDIGFREKSKETITKKYNVSHYSKTDEFKVKVRSTSLKKYGIDNYSKTIDYKIKYVTLERRRESCDNN